MSVRSIVAGAVLASGLAAAHPADAQPERTPERDVEVIYRITNPGEAPSRSRVRWQAATQLERIDTPGGTALIIDHKNNSATVLTAHRTYSVLQLNGPPSADFAAYSGEAARTETHVKIAGMDCSVQEWSDPADRSKRSECVSADGVVLERRKDGRTVAKAASVTYGKQAATVFAAPDNYEPSLETESGVP